jgi:hypothetical protein
MVSFLAFPKRCNGAHIPLIPRPRQSRRGPRAEDRFRVIPGWGLARKQLGNGVDKSSGRVDGGSRVTGRDCVDRGTDAVIGDRFEFVPLREKGQEFAFDARLLPRQAVELASDAAMCFGSLAGALEKVGFGGMVCGEIGLARCDVRKPGGSDPLGASKTVTPLIQIVGSFGLYKSSPSLRSSRMKPVRSRSAPARNGMAEITAPVSSRISVVSEASR